MKEVAIPNWTMFDVSSVAVQLSKFEDDGEIFYVPHILHWLDGADDDENEYATILIAHGLAGESPEVVAFNAAHICKTMYGCDIMDQIMVFDEEGNELEEEGFSLNERAEFMSQIDPEDVKKDRILH